MKQWVDQWPYLNLKVSINQSISKFFNVFTLASNSQKFRTCVDSTMTLWMWLIQSPILSQLYTLERLRDLLRVTGAGPESLMVRMGQCHVTRQPTRTRGGEILANRQRGCHRWPGLTHWHQPDSLTESGMQQQQQQHQRHVGSCCCCGVEEEIMRSFAATFFH